MYSTYTHVHVYMNIYVFVCVYVCPKSMNVKALTAVAASTEQEKVERIPVVRLLAPVNYKTINQNVAPN